jgi:hypothetical protein
VCERERTVRCDCIQVPLKRLALVFTSERLSVSNIPVAMAPVPCHVVIDWGIVIHPYLACLDTIDGDNGKRRALPRGLLLVTRMAALQAEQRRETQWQPRVQNPVQKRAPHLGHSVQIPRNCLAWVSVLECVRRLFTEHMCLQCLDANYSVNR